jgi:hypothetical protein
MAKQLKDILNGVKASKIVPGSTGSDPGVDYAPKAPDEQEFVKKHSTEKHADRVGNGDDIYQATNIKHVMASPKEDKHGHKKPADKKVYEAAKCNMTEAGTACPVHEMADCTKKSLREVAKNPYAIGMAAAMKKTGDKPPLKKSTITKAHDIAKSVAKEELETVDEASMTSGQKTAYRMGMTHGSKGVKKIDAVKSFGLHADYYHRGYEQGKDSEEWHEKQRTRNESLAVPLIGSTDDDESAEMAKTQLRALANKAIHLAMQLSDDQVVEPWVQSKIAVAKDYVTAVHDYMLYGDNGSKKEQSAPYDGSIDMTGAPRNTVPSFSADVNTGRVV